MAKDYIDTCFICNSLQLVERHYKQLMCHNCYHLCQRIRARYKKETGIEMDIDEMLTKATTRRAELKEGGKWSQNAKNRPPNIAISILK